MYSGARTSRTLAWDIEYYKNIQYNILCVQLCSISGSEDFLYLNVYTPETYKTLLTVMIWRFGFMEKFLLWATKTLMKMDQSSL